ncbi:MAG TPA: hypothetical protein VHK88_00100 [Aquihabitans sp.]|jgi:hypothetical protein|nr:hypothetical protein [Aquihabitans sp.]
MTRHDRPQKGRPAGVGTHRQDTSEAPDETPIIRLDKGILPDIERIARSVERRLTAQSPALLRCRHVFGGSAALACAAHPVAGLMCPACAERHSLRHAHKLEHTCDRCHQQGTLMFQLMADAVIGATTITTAGKPARYVGAVVVVCLGVCEACAAEVGLPEEAAS